MPTTKSKTKEPAQPKGEKLNPMVLDLSHHNTVTSFQDIYYSGIRGIIHKATEGSSYVDPTYASRRSLAKSVGLLWGAYHFFRPGDITAQVEHFLRHADPEPGTLLALDHEDERCSAADAIQFIKLLEAKTGRLPVLYSGHLIKDQLGNQVDQYLGTCRLWHAQYGPQPHTQASWDSYWLWQFTDGQHGPDAPKIKGVDDSNLDVNSFRGTYEELADQWVGGLIGAVKPGTYEWVRWGQATLNLLGHRPGLVVDGHLGPKTLVALEIYQRVAIGEPSGTFDAETVEKMLLDVENANGNR